MLLFNLLETLARAGDVALEVLLLVGAQLLAVEPFGVARGLVLRDANLLVDFADGVDEALARVLRQVEQLHLLRDLKAHARDLALEAQELLRLLPLQKLLLGAQLLPLLQARLKYPPDVLDTFERPAQVLVGLVLLTRQLGLLREGDVVPDVQAVRLQLLADLAQLLDRDGRARDGLLSLNLPALDALGDGDLALAREQRHDAHLAQVEADGVVRLLKDAGREV